MIILNSMIRGKSMRSLLEIIVYSSAKKRKREQAKNALELQIKLLEGEHKLNLNTNIITQLKRIRLDLVL